MYKLDKRPLLEGCKCYTCRTHTRAYVHHLLCEHELLSSALLYIHNLHHTLTFMKSVRRSISAGKFEEFIEEFHRASDLI